MKKIDKPFNKCENELVNLILKRGQVNKKERFREIVNYMENTFHTSISTYWLQERLIEQGLTKEQSQKAVWNFTNRQVKPISSRMFINEKDKFVSYGEFGWEKVSFNIRYFDFF